MTIENVRKSYSAHYPWNPKCQRGFPRPGNCDSFESIHRSLEWDSGGFGSPAVMAIQARWIEIWNSGSLPAGVTTQSIGDRAEPKDAQEEIYVGLEPMFRGDVSAHPCQRADACPQFDGPW